MKKFTLAVAAADSWKPDTPRVASVPTPHPSTRPRLRASLVALGLCVTCSVYDQGLLVGVNAGGGGGTEGGLGGGGASSGAGGSDAPRGGQGATSGTGGSASSGNGGTSGGDNHGGDAGDDHGHDHAGVGGGAAGDDSVGAGGAAYELIDDMEDGNRFVLTGTDRDGFWQTHNDATVGSTQEPPQGAATFTMTELATAGAPRGDSLYAAGMHVTGFAGPGWGALMVVSMRAAGTSIDASAFCGLHFWAKRGPENSDLVLRVVDKYSSPAGGLCTDSEDAGDQRCNDDFHTSVPVTPEWNDYMVRFEDLVQWGFGYKSPSGKLDPATLFGIVFSVDEVEDYEILVDDLELVHTGHCG